MATGLIDIMKRAATEAVENGKPCDLRYGMVISESPLKIQITPQFILPESVLIVPQHLTDYEIEITTTGYGWITEHKSGGAGESAFSSHNHDIKQEKRKLKVHGELKSGDKVVLIRQHGGQYYFVADRLPKEG